MGVCCNGAVDVSVCAVAVLHPQCESPLQGHTPCQLQAVNCLQGRDAFLQVSFALLQVFVHNDVAHLERLLRDSIAYGQPKTRRPWKKILIIVEGIYSMEGEMCPLPAIVELKKRYKVLLLTTCDCHCFCMLLHLSCLSYTYTFTHTHMHSHTCTCTRIRTRIYSFCMWLDGDIVACCKACLHSSSHGLFLRLHLASAFAAFDSGSWGHLHF